MAVIINSSTAGVVDSASPGSLPRIVYNASPNLTLNDTSGGAGTTATPFAITYTIPGGLMGSASLIDIYSVIDWVGGNSKNAIIRVGPASGTWATATQIGGQSGLSSQIYTPECAYIWNDNSLTQQRATPANSVNQWNSSTSSRASVLNIDTSLDWNIYIGVQFGLLNGGDTATLRRVIIRQLA